MGVGTSNYFPTYSPHTSKWNSPGIKSASLLSFTPNTIYSNSVSWNHIETYSVCSIAVVRSLLEDLLLVNVSRHLIG